MSYTIKQTTKITGLSSDTLRYYEKEGIISPKRYENGCRYYDENDITALKHIVVMKYAHFTLTEMESMEELQTREPSVQCNEISKGILIKKISELSNAIYNYKKIVTLMEALLPMVESVDAHHRNEQHVDKFIKQVFDDIMSTWENLC